jgi:hypothetical protein
VIETERSRKKRGGERREQRAESEREEYMRERTEDWWPVDDG